MGTFFAVFLIQVVGARARCYDGLLRKGDAASRYDALWLKRTACSFGLLAVALLLRE